MRKRGRLWWRYKVCQTYNLKRAFSPRNFFPREDFSATHEKSDRAGKNFRAEKKLG